MLPTEERVRSVRYPSTVREPDHLLQAATMHRLPRLVTTALRAIAFWAAVALPLAYVPALLGPSRAELVLALLPLDALCLVVGHEHTPGSRLGGPTQS